MRPRERKFTSERGSRTWGGGEKRKQHLISYTLRSIDANTPPGSRKPAETVCYRAGQGVISSKLICTPDQARRSWRWEYHKGLSRLCSLSVAGKLALYSYKGSSRTGKKCLCCSLGVGEEGKSLLLSVESGGRKKGAGRGRLFRPETSRENEKDFETSMGVQTLETV